jgi:hypothetical protein
MMQVRRGLHDASAGSTIEQQIALRAIAGDGTFRQQDESDEKR